MEKEECLHAGSKIYACLQPGKMIDANKTQGCSDVMGICVSHLPGASCIPAADPEEQRKLMKVRSSCCFLFHDNKALFSEPQVTCLLPSSIQWCHTKLVVFNRVKSQILLQVLQMAAALEFPFCMSKID